MTMADGLISRRGSSCSICFTSSGEAWLRDTSGHRGPTSPTACSMHTPPPRAYSGSLLGACRPLRGAGEALRAAQGVSLRAPAAEPLASEDLRQELAAPFVLRPGH